MVVLQCNELLRAFKKSTFELLFIRNVHSLRPIGSHLESARPNGNLTPAWGVVDNSARLANSVLSSIRLRDKGRLAGSSRHSSPARPVDSASVFGSRPWGSDLPELSENQFLPQWTGAGERAFGRVRLPVPLAA